VYVNVTNNGGSSLILSTARIGNFPAQLTIDYHSDLTTIGTTLTTLSPGEQAGLKITYTGKDFTPGVPYTITIVTSTNKEFPTIGTPPGP